MAVNIRQDWKEQNTWNLSMEAIVRRLISLKILREFSIVDWPLFDGRWHLCAARILDGYRWLYRQSWPCRAFSSTAGFLKVVLPWFVLLVCLYRYKYIVSSRPYASSHPFVATGSSCYFFFLFGGASLYLYLVYIFITSTLMYHILLRFTFFFFLSALFVVRESFAMGDSTGIYQSTSAWHRPKLTARPNVPRSIA